MPRVVLLLLLAVGLHAQVTLESNGAPANRLDLLILGDGYTAAEQSKFATDAQNLANSFFSQEPLTSYRKLFNVARVDLVSNLSGASHTGQSGDTALGAYYNCASIERLICIDNAKVNAVLVTIPAAQRDLVVVLVNDTEYGGSGGAVAVASLHPQVLELVLHEAGHSFALLADEYGGPPPPACDTSREPSAANATRETDRSRIKWNAWIDAATPLPTGGTTNGVPGAYAGAAYCDAGMFRPTFNSKMRALGQSFDQINTEQWVRRYYNTVPLIALALPDVSNIAVPSSQTFAVVTPAIGTIKITWTLDGQSVATGESYNLSAAAVAPGTHTLLAQVKDETPLVRSDPNGVLAQTRQWTVTTSAAACTNLSIAAPGGVGFALAGGAGSFGVTASGCDWTATTTADWISIGNPAGSGNGTVSFTATANTATTSRSALINVSGQSFVVAQAGTACTTTVSPTSIAAAGVGAAGSITVTVPGIVPCPYDAVSGASWITVSKGAGSVSYTVAGNPSPLARAGAIAIGEKIVTVSQAGLAPNLGAGTNAASFLSLAVAPGELVTLFGSDIGPATLTGLVLTPSGQVDTQIAGTRVLFDGVPGPMIYASRNQTSVVAPFGIAGKTSVQVQVELLGVRSSPLTLPVRSATPGLFTANSSGQGPAAALNGDLSFNNTSNPAAPGGVVVLYLTGGGQTVPPSSDGVIAMAADRTALTVTATIGGQSAEVLYAGSAPGIVAGVMQVNLRVPAVSGAVPVVVTIDGVQSQPNVTVAVR